MPSPARPGEGAARSAAGGAGVVCRSRDGETPAASFTGSGCAGLGGPEGARPRARWCPRVERGGERAMDPKAGGGEDEDCVDSGAETGG